jgi:hypothetical protein
MKTISVGANMYRGAENFLARIGFKSPRLGFSVDYHEYWY